MKTKTRFIIYFIDRTVYVSLLKGNAIELDKKTDNASRDLIGMITSILEEKDLSLYMVDEIGFLSVPSSFTTTRIISATCFGLSLNSNIKVYPLKLEDAVYSIEKYNGKPILVKLNQNLWYLYKNNVWTLIDCFYQDQSHIVYNHAFTDIKLGLLNILNKITD